MLAVTNGDVLELGAGTGKLAADLLLAFACSRACSTAVFILEVSAYLRQIQKETLQKSLSPELFKRVVWLEALPQNFVGVILGNEVLDAIPVHLVHKTAGGLYERGRCRLCGRF